MANEFAFNGRLQGINGATVDLVVADVEGKFLGFSLTERQGLNMRLVAGEMRDLDHVIALRDSLDAYIQRAQSAAATQS